MTFGRCWPSAADEEWYSPKRSSSTVAVNELNTKVSAFFPHYTLSTHKLLVHVMLLPPEGSAIPWPAARSLAAVRKDRLSGTTWDGTDAEMTTVLDQVLERVHEQRSLQGTSTFLEVPYKGTVSRRVHILYVTLGNTNQIQ